jgi:predicted RNA-binding Zn-ribbon protein involved in translation (DUF1610 family)
MKRLIRRLFPIVQDATCTTCGRELRERRRRPCPTCGDTARIIVRGLELTVDTIDRIG